MKNILLVMLMLCFALGAVAQQIGFTYQAVALDESKAEGFGRDSKGQILLNQALKVRFSIHEQSADGTVQYQEVHETTTDIFGIFRVVIGSGEKLLGTSLEALQWSDQAYFMQVEIDLGNGFINMGEEVIVVPPFGLDNTAQLLNLSGTQLSISEGNSVDLGNLLSASRLSEAEVDAFVSNNGYLLLEVDGSVTNELQNLSSDGTAGHLAISEGNQVTINVNDDDADPLNEIQDLQITDGQLIITNNPNATIINLSPYLGNNLTEEDVDNMVANNGFLTEEIQDLNLIGNTLTITNNTTATNIDLSPYRNIFVTTSNITSNENGNYALDDFVYGSSSLDHPAAEAQRNRLFFDKSKGALRAGSTNDASWNDTNRGFYSTAFGFNNIATGVSSFSVGEGNTSSGGSAISFGAGNTSSGSFSLSGGTSNNAIGYSSIALGFINNAIGYNAIAMGDNSLALGDFSKVFAHNSTAYSYGETVLGTLATEYIPLGDLSPTDRLFVIGNGVYDYNSTPPYSFTRSDALVMLKNGNTRLNGQLTIDADNINGMGEAYTLPGQDGAANQVMTTDGNGNVSWSTPITLSETDVDDFVSDNGFLTTEVDGSVTNEIQDLALANNMLSITSNAAATPISLAPYLDAAFRTTAGVTSNAPGNYATDDFVFGSPTLDYTGQGNRMFFDKSKGAFRAGAGSWFASNGTSDVTNWDNVNVGNFSVGLGWAPRASGSSSIALGYRTVASALSSVSIGREATASGQYSISIGASSSSTNNGSVVVGGASTASGYRSYVFGSESTATDDYGLAIGYNAISTGIQASAIGHYVNSSGDFSMALGRSAQAQGEGSLSIGFGTIASGTRSNSFGLSNFTSSFGETALGIYATNIANPLSSDTWNELDRLLVLGNGQSTALRSDALVMLKNGNTRLHGQLTIDADNVNGAGEQYTLPGQDGDANQVMTTDGNGNVTWTTPAAIVEVDGSITNEIQDLAIANDVLSITNNPAPTNIDLAPYRNVFEITNNVTSNENGNYATDDFLFGSPQFAYDANPNHFGRMFFDKSKGAFRAGYASGYQWDDANVGLHSVGLGNNAIASGSRSFAVGWAPVASGNNSVAMVDGVASGLNSVAIGSSPEASGNSAIAFGTQASAGGSSSIAAGHNATATGTGSLALGTFGKAFATNAVSIGNSLANASNSVAIGNNVTASGEYAFAFGRQLESRSYGETTFGFYGTLVIPNSTAAFFGQDRLFTIANGTGPVASRSDAFVMLKNGSTRLHGQLTIDADNVNGAGEQYTLPGQDGNANQVMTTDGSGNVSWTTPAALIEVDGSVTNEIQDLAIANDVLSITNNTTPTNIDLAPYRNVFETTNNVTSNENGNYTTDDFVFGSPQLADDGNTSHDRRMLFDKSKGAFRVGIATEDQWNDLNIGIYSVAAGYNAIARGNHSFSVTGNAAADFSIAVGANSVATGNSSVAIGVGTQAADIGSIAIGGGSATHPGSIILGTGWNQGDYAVALGTSLQSQGNYSMSIGHSSTIAASASEGIAIGNYLNVLGTRGISIGTAVTSYASNEIAFGTFGPSYIPQGNDTDRLFSIANGISNAQRSHSLVILKNGNTRLHGQLTIDADNVTGAGGSYTLPGQRGTDGQIMMTDGSGNVSWTTPAALVEVDGSITNEIQDLTIANDVLTITNNAAATDINLAPYRNVFEITSNITSNENGDYATDSFVIGSPGLDDDGDATHDTRLLFEKSTGAFRVGTVTDTRWDAAERGTNSVAMGLGNIARGSSSLSLGQNNLAHSASSVAMGTNNQAEGYNSLALGRNVATTGVHSMALSLYSSSRSYGETTMGIYAADYVPNSTTNFDGNDRLFTIGNGLDDANRSNALVVFKNGDANVNGQLTIDADNVSGIGQAYTFPGQDGASGQLMLTDGAGHASWSNIINGDLTVAGVFSNPSDSRLKRNITPLNNSLVNVTTLNGFHYNWNNKTMQDTLALQTGLIAQEVEKIFPELVKTDEEGFKSVNYIGLVPHLIEAIKELKKENNELKSETEKTKLATEQRIATMEAKLMKIELLMEKANH